MLYVVLVLCRSHEQMSVNMVDYIVDEHHIDVDSEMIKRVKVSLKYYDILFPVVLSILSF